MRRASGDAAALRQPDHQSNQSKHQQQMDGATEGVAADHSQRPHQKQNEENREHKNQPRKRIRREGSCGSCAFGKVSLGFLANATGG